jgi:hypothetical protein
MTLQCDLCPSPAIAVRPGSEAVTQVGIVLSRGVPRRQWCLRCWTQRFRVAEEAA